MQTSMIPAVVAVVVGFTAAALLAIPYLVWTYRRRGELGIGHAFLAFAFLIYLTALWTYTLLPLPQETHAWCVANATSQPQLTPLRFLDDIAVNASGPGAAALLHNPAVQQVVLNIVLFVPLGMFCRHLLHRGVTTTIAIGLAVSLFIEFTQLTGIWFLFECPYRLFDVDDLLMNTAGTALGVLAAPLLRAVPWQRGALAPSRPRPVTGARRLLGMVLDLVLTAATGVVLSVSIELASGSLLHDGSHVPFGSGGVLGAIVTDWVPVVLVVLLPALGRSGATPGQRIVRLAPITRAGTTPGPLRRLLRFLSGTGGYFGLAGASVLTPLGPLPFLLLAVSLIMVWLPRDHRGLSGTISGIRVRDARS